MENTEDMYSTIIHRNRKTKTLVGNSNYENYIINHISNIKFSGVVDSQHEHRPDLLSDVLLGDPDLWWLILDINAVFDPFDGLNSGDAIIG